MSAIFLDLLCVKNTQNKMNKKLNLAKTEKQKRYWEKLQPVNRVATTDTYKRTMSGSSELFSDNFSCYNLAARRPMNEEGVNNRYIMAGIEKMIYPWFMNPITKEEINEAKEFFMQEGKVKKFPEKAWQSVIDNDGHLPIDIWGLPGGQTFLAKDGKHVPIMSVEGAGALVTHLEPHLENIYAPLIHATKARLFKEEVGDKFAEFGLRSAPNVNDHVSLLHSLYIGGKFRLTSDDQAVYLFPEYFDDIGTVGHEFIMAEQNSSRTLEEAQEISYRKFIEENDRSALLPDTISTIKSGLPMILKLRKEYEPQGKIVMPRFDSGNILEQTIYWKKMCLEAGFNTAPMVVEDGYNPIKAKETKENYAAHGFDPNEITVGAGGYFQEGCSRDIASLVYKRSATEHEGKLEKSLKFSDSPGKESLPGQIRIYENKNKLIVAQAGEYIDGKMISVPLVKNGKIVYNETLDEQNTRAEETWEKYETIVYSPETQKIIDLRNKERQELLNKFEVMIQ